MRLRRLAISLLLISSLATLPDIGRAAPPPSLSPQDHLSRARAFDKASQYDQAIAAYQDYLAARPEDDEARGALARILSWQGRYGEAAGLYQDILSRHPADLDVRAALARVNAWRKKFPESQTLYEAVLKEDPEHHEAKRGLADLFYWTGRYTEALSLYQDLMSTAPGKDVDSRIESAKAELAALTPSQALRAPVGLVRTLPALPFRDYFKIGYSHYTYSNQVPDERAGRVEAARSVGNQTFVGRIEPTSRFGSVDVPVSGELYSPLWNKAWGYIGGSAALNPTFVPNVLFGGELFQGLGVVHESLSFLEPSFGYRHLQFKSTGIDILIPGLTLYLPANVWLTEKVYYVPDFGATTLSSQITWRPTDRLQFWASGAFGTAGERIVAEQDLVRVSTLIVQGGGIFPLSGYLSAEVVGTYEDRGSLYIRRGGTFNLIFHW